MLQQRRSKVCDPAPFSVLNLLFFKLPFDLTLNVGGPVIANLIDITVIISGTSFCAKMVITVDNVQGQYREQWSSFRLLGPKQCTFGSLSFFSSFPKFIVS